MRVADGGKTAVAMRHRHASPGRAAGVPRAADRHPAAARQGVWRLVYHHYVPGEETLRETLCATGNGYLVTRGAAPESRADAIHYPGTYVGGIYNRLTTQIAGQAVEDESLVNLPNWLPLTFRVDGGPWFRPDDVEILGYEQELDLRRGLLTRWLRFADQAGRHIHLTQRRFASMDDPHLAALEVAITAEDWAGQIEIRSALDGDVANTGVARYRQLESRHLTDPEFAEIDAETFGLRTATTQSGIVIAMAARTRVLTTGDPPGARLVTREGGQLAHQIPVRVERGRTVVAEKVVSVYTSRDPAISEPAMEARRTLARAGDFGDLLHPHVIRLHSLWERTHLKPAEDERAGFILNLHVFHLMQTISQSTTGLDAGIPARGLHGEAYRGHVFWDELFVLPYLILTLPELTRSMLRYRHRRLPEARRAALDAGFAGAMFPWQSGSDGREESPAIHLNPRSGRWRPDNSRRQRHINSAIAWNFWYYYQATADQQFMCTFGAEVLLEIARFWASVARYDEARGRYVIEGVLGPDEYHDGYPWSDEPGLANNAYTNVMAVWVLCRALELLEQLPLQRREALRSELRLTEAETERWDDISRRMFIPFHDGVIISQFEGYERLEEFDWDGYLQRYGNIQRLDRILEAESDTPNRYKASKQADVLMLFYLLSAEELEGLFTRLGYPWDAELIPRNIDYYARRTSHGSTLSRIVHSWVLARANRPGSWELFTQALESDLADIQHGTTAEGIHLGAMAGTVDLAARGYTGLELRGDVLWLHPCVPHVDPPVSLSFGIRYRHHWNVGIQVAGGRIRVTVPPADGDGTPITIGYEGALTDVGPGETFDAPLPERALPPAIVTVTIDRRRHDAVIFDLDGVITDTASVHAAAWKRLFDAYLSARAEAGKEDHSPFTENDYARYVDGKPRQDGVTSFLASRGITIPIGRPSDGEDTETAHGLGRRKDHYYLALLKSHGVKVFGSTVTLVRQLRAAGIPTAVFSASRNCRHVLEAAGIGDLFGVRVDGVVAARLGLPGKPDPAVLLEAARQLGADPARSVVVEDAEAGVEAGRRGGFGLVIGVDRTGRARALRDHGADVVVRDLSEVEVSPGATRSG